MHWKVLRGEVCGMGWRDLSLIWNSWLKGNYEYFSLANGFYPLFGIGDFKSGEEKFLVCRRASAEIYDPLSFTTHQSIENIVMGDFKINQTLFFTCASEYLHTMEVVKDNKHRWIYKCLMDSGNTWVIPTRAL